MKKFKEGDFSREIIDLITEDWKDDKQLVMDALYYLYHTTTDNVMKSQIKDIFYEEHCCLNCGSQMQYYEYQEPHMELYPVEYETFGCYICPVCSKK